MGADFWLTRAGVRLAEVTLPRLADEMANLTNAINALVIILRERAPAAPTTPAPAETTEPHQG